MGGWGPQAVNPGPVGRAQGRRVIPRPNPIVIPGETPADDAVDAEAPDDLDSGGNVGGVLAEVQRRGGASARRRSTVVGPMVLARASIVADSLPSRLFNSERCVFPL